MSLSKRLISTDAAGGADGSTNFAPVIWTGTGASQSISSLSFAPDLIWVKQRSGTRDHIIADTVRGPSTNLNLLYPYGTFAESTSVGSEFIRSIQSNGFTIGNHVYVSELNETYVAWCFKAGGSAVSNTDGAITSTVSANTAAGFSIVSLDKPNLNTDTYGHGLNSAPEMIILKRLASSDDWHVYQKDLGNTVRISLNSNAAKVTGTGVWGSTTPTDSVFTLQNQTGGAHIAYCFHSVAGYQKIGTYTGNTSSYPRVYTTDDGTSTGANGFMPRFLMIKNYNAVYHWAIYDNAREPITSEGESREKQLYPNTTQIENGNLFGDPAGRIDFYNDGFQPQAALGNINQNGGSFIYLAIA